MSVIIQGYQLRAIAFGVQVIKRAQTPPNSGSSANLFAIAGGAVLITSLLGRVSTVLSGSTGTIALGLAPTTGTANTGGLAGAAVVGGLEVGTFVGLQASSGKAGTLVAGAHAGDGLFVPTPITAYTGNLTITTAVATMTGAIDWYLTYIPLDTGATVS